MSSNDIRERLGEVHKGSQVHIVGCAVMTDQAQITHPLIVAVRTAEAACLTALTDEERRTAMVALMTAGVALDLKVKRLYDGETVSGWLLSAADWLDANPQHPEWFEREEVWMARLAEYQELLGALIDERAMLNVTEFSREAPAMAQEEMAL